VAQLPSMEEEFREFVAARSGALLRTAYLLAGDWSTAEDLLQTALTKTYLAWKRLGRIEAVEPYTRRVLVNTATSWWRRRWHGERPTEVLPEQPGPDQHEQAVDRDLMWQYVRRLPARQRAVLVLRFYEDLSEAETADLLEISRGTVKSQTARALATLRKNLDADGVMPTRRPGTAPPSLATGLPTVAPVAAEEESTSGEEILASGGGSAGDGAPLPVPARTLRSEPAAALRSEPAAALRSEPAAARRAGAGEGA
jgi:RNA polymerase sigma-70 factor, ECF subfamily